MKKSYIFLSEGFEDIEAIAIIDILRRAEIPVESVSMNDTLEVNSSHGVVIKADTLFADCKSELSDALCLILPGGSMKLNEYDELKTLVKEHNDKGAMLAAICAAPSVLGAAGVLEGRKATCYPSFEQYLIGADVADDVSKVDVVVDENIITGNGPASTLKFAYRVVEEICGAEKADSIKQQMMYI